MVLSIDYSINCLEYLKLLAYLFDKINPKAQTLGVKILAVPLHPRPCSPAPPPSLQSRFAPVLAVPLRPRPCSPAPAWWKNHAISIATLVVEIYRTKAIGPKP